MFDGFDCDCDGGIGLGWIFPAIIVGKLISSAFERPDGRGYSAANPARPPQPASPAPVTTSHTGPLAGSRCQNCAGVLNPDFAFCPRCGQKVMPATCRYCGQQLIPEMSYCAHCGGPARH